MKNILLHSIIICFVVVSNIFAQYLGSGFGYHSVAVDSNFNMYVWGLNQNGQLGLGNTTNIKQPQKVIINKKVISVVTGGDHTLAITEDSILYAWGKNSFGQLGIGTFNNSNSPVQVYTGGILNNKKFKKIAAGINHCIALDTEGNLYTWGVNYDGQLGDNSFNDSNLPVKVYTTGNIGDKKVVDIAAGGFHSLALTEDNQLYSWGDNLYGQLGIGISGDRNTPTKVIDTLWKNKEIKFISAGLRFSVVVTKNNQVFTFGLNQNGELGNGNFINSNVPVKVTSYLLNNVAIKKIVSGGNFTLLLLDDNRIIAWGKNTYGQLGDGTTNNSSVPVLTTLPLQLKNVGICDIGVGETHSMLLANDGTLYTWGDNYFGQLGNGTTQQSNIPAIITLSLPLNNELLNEFDFYLYQNYPNPFNPVTKIVFSIPKNIHKHKTSLIVYDVLGKIIKILFDEYASAGTYQVYFDASDLSSGIYFYALRCGNLTQTKKLILQK